MCEVELIVKSRLIKKSLNDPSDCRALIPNHLLFGQNHDFNPWFISTKKTCTTIRGGERFDISPQQSGVSGLASTCHNYRLSDRSD